MNIDLMKLKKMNVGEVFMSQENEYKNQKGKIKVLMVGPARTVKGGMTTVVDNYFKYGLTEKVELNYCESINDKSNIQKGIKEIIGYLKFKNIFSKYDIIHIHMASGRSAFRKLKYLELAKKNNKKVIVHIHGGGFADFYKSLNENKKKIVKGGLLKADKLIVLSEEWKVFFKNIVPVDKIEVLYNGVEVPSDFHKDCNNEKILFLGRICEDKGIYSLLSAIGSIKNDYPNLILNICGSGENEKVSNYIMAHKLEKNVKFVGWVSGSEKIMQLKNNSIFILPSKFEAMPMSLLEAMAYENVVVCTDVGGIPQVVQDGVNGVLMKDNSKDSIINALHRVLDFPLEKRQMATKAKFTIETRFDISNNIKALFCLYKEVYSKNGA